MGSLSAMGSLPLDSSLPPEATDHNQPKRRKVDANYVSTLSPLLFLSPWTPSRPWTNLPYRLDIHFLPTTGGTSRPRRILPNRIFSSSLSSSVGPSRCPIPFSWTLFPLRILYRMSICTLKIRCLNPLLSLLWRPWTRYRCLTFLPFLLFPISIWLQHNPLSLSTTLYRWILLSSRFLFLPIPLNTNIRPCL